MELTPRENDVIALAEFRLLELADHPGESFTVAPEIVPEFLGTILMLASRIRRPAGNAREFDDPREFAEAVIKQHRKAAAVVARLR
jgi:hypothetical protein